MFYHCEIKSVGNLIKIIKEDTREWSYTSKMGGPWFRGLAKADYKLIPSIFRKEYEERGLAQMFRNRAPVLGNTPERSGSVDEWLFLMQHYGAPTRLLDWTESAIIGLFFTLYTRTSNVIDENNDAALWMLHPLKLNKLKLSIGKSEFPNTWSDHKCNIVRHNLSKPFATGGKPSVLPIAIQTTYSKNVMASQKSCFTIHGENEQDFETMFEGRPFECKGYIRKYLVPSRYKKGIAEDLEILGITHSVVFPDFAGLSTELEQRFRKDYVAHKKQLMIKKSFGTIDFDNNYDYKKARNR